MRKQLLLAAVLACTVVIRGFSQEDGVVGTLNSNGVRIRQEPTLQGKQIGSLAAGDQVIVLGRTEDTMKIDTMVACWYWIRTKAGVEGWAYGYYIDADASTLPVVAPAPAFAVSKLRVLKESISPRVVFTKMCAMGGVLYAASNRGLEILGLEDPLHPRPIKTVAIPSTVSAIAADARYAYLLGENSFFIVDATSPSSASMVKSIHVENAEQIILDKGYLYIICISGNSGKSDVKIVDARDPARASIITNVDTGICTSFHKFGGFLYATDGKAIQIIDVSNPSRASVVSTLPAESIRDLYVIETIAYLACDKRLDIVDLSNPKKPRTIRTLDVPASGIEISGKRAYVQGGGKLTILDLTDPVSASVMASSILDLRSLEKIEIAGQHALFTEKVRQILIQDPSMCVSVFDISQTPPVACANSFFTDGDTCAANGYLYSSIGSRIDVIDLSDPKTASVKSQYREGGAYGVRMKGEYAFVATSSGIDIYNLKNPVAVSAVKTIEMPNSPGGEWGGWDMANNRTAVLWRSREIETSWISLIDLSNPSSPALTTTYEMKAFLFDIAEAGDYLYASDGRSFYILDVSDPSSISLRSKTDIPGGVGTYRVAGSFAYLGGNRQLFILEIRDPAHASIVKTINLPSSPSSIGFWGKHAYALMGLSGLAVIDISDPSAAAVVGTADLSNLEYTREEGAEDEKLDPMSGVSESTATSIWGLYAHKGCFFIESSLWRYVSHDFGTDSYLVRARLNIVDARKPLKAALCNSIEWSGGRVLVSGDFVFMAGQYNSIRVIDAKDPGSPSFVRDVEVTSIVSDLAVGSRCIVAACGDNGFSVIGE